MPVYFRVGERELNLAEGEARGLASRLPVGRLRDEISARVGANDSRLVYLDIGGDERGNLLALSAAIDSAERDERDQAGDEAELPRALTTLRAAVVEALDSIEEPPDRLRRAPPPE
jgi:hypothetical protein